MLGAVGDQTGNVSLWCLPYRARLNVRKELQHKGESWAIRAEVDWSMAYLENMSSVGMVNPDFDREIDKIKALCGTRTVLKEERLVPIYTFLEVL